MIQFLSEMSQIGCDNPLAALCNIWVDKDIVQEKTNKQ